MTQIQTLLMGKVKYLHQCPQTPHRMTEGDEETESAHAQEIERE